MINLLTKGKVPALVLFIFLLALTPLKSLAVTITQDGITYSSTGTSLLLSVVQVDKSLSGEIEVPSSVYYNSKFYTVNKISYNAFEDCTEITAISLPKTISTIESNAFLGTTSLTAINVNPESSYFSSVDGVLYNKAQIKIIKYPQGKTDASFAFPNTVSIIGENCFQGSKSLEEITIPTEVTAIPNYCFNGCSGLKSVTLPETLTSIGVNSFNGCATLTSINLPQSVRSIGNYSFSNCTSLTSITIPEWVTTMGSGMFSGCSSLTAINVDAENSQFTSVDGVLFDKAQTNLISYPIGKTATEYTIPTNVNKISTRAFMGSTRLSSVVIPEETTTIESSAFANCSNLSKVTCLATTPPTISTSASTASFLNTPADKTLLVPAEAVDAYMSSDWNNYFTTIKENPIEFTIGNLTYTILEEGAVSVRAVNKSISGDVVVPATVDYNGTTYTVIRPEETAFNGCPALTSVTLPKTITGIHSYTFNNSPALTAIYVDSENVKYTSIDGILFNKTTRVIMRYPEGKAGDSYSIPSTAPQIFNCAFYGAQNLTSVEIPASVTAIYPLAFANCSKLIKVVCLATTPPAIATTGDAAFQNTAADKTLYVPGAAVEAYKGSDWNNIFSTIKAIEFTIGDLTYTTLAATGTVSVKAANTEISGEVTIPETVSYAGITYTVKKIQGAAFKNCSNVTSIKIPKTINSLVADSFNNTPSLTAFIVDSENTAYSSDNGILFNKSKTQLLRYPEGKLEDSYTIPESVKTLFQDSFYSCKKLKSVVIPASVTTLGYTVFGACYNLAEVTCLGKTPPNISTVQWAESLVTYSNKTLYIPKGTLDAYKAKKWNDYFNNVVELSPLTINIVGEGKVYNDNVAIASGTVIEEGSVNLLILPDDGYHIESVSLKGVDVKDRIVNHFLSVEDCSNAGVLEVFFAENEVVGEPEEASLTVNGGDTHSLAHYYTEGTQAKINLKPNTGWELYSLAYNGDDVTNEVDNNTYTTPELYGHDNNLDIVMKKSQTTGANAAYTQRRISFRSFGEIVEIFNLEDGENISIYDLEGNCKYQGSNHTVSLTPGNVYILNTNNETLKFSH